jgi:hypothetical protein
MRVPLILLLVLGGPVAPLTKAAAGLSQAASDEKPLRAVAFAQDSQERYQAQLLGEMDRPVGESIEFGGDIILARKTDDGKLELDLKGDGKYRPIAKHEVLSLPAKGDGDKPKTIVCKVEFRKTPEGVWVYRNLTHLRVQLGTETFVLVDANCNGVYNEPGQDGLAWEGIPWVFPLPAPSERWCSATLELTGFKIGPVGESPAVLGKPLATTVPAALPILRGVNEERVWIGLTPRPEDPKLSADLQKHCKYEAQNNTLTHPETPGRPGYTPEGNEAGMRSILSSGSAADHVALGMVQTYFHRQDVLRPNTLAFGVAYEGAYGGIDGRTHCSKAPPNFWPVLSPAPGQTGIGTHYGKESPDACPGNPNAGWPVTAYFGTSKLKLKSYSLKALGPVGPAGKAPPAPVAPAQVAGLPPIDCYPFDPQTGAQADFTRYQQCVALISKEPLKVNELYEVTLAVDVEGKPWTRTWRFSTSAPLARSPGRRP